MKDDDDDYLGGKFPGRELVLLVMVLGSGLSAQLAQGLQDGLHKLLFCQLLWLELSQPVHHLHPAAAFAPTAAILW